MCVKDVCNSNNLHFVTSYKSLNFVKNSQFNVPRWNDFVQEKYEKEKEFYGQHTLW